MDRSVKIECPYCGTEINYCIEEKYGKQLITCDIEEGGCDKDFAIETKTIVEVKTFKIEGEQDEFRK